MLKVRIWESPWSGKAKPCPRTGKVTARGLEEAGKRKSVSLCPSELGSQLL